MEGGFFVVCVFLSTTERFIRAMQKRKNGKWVYLEVSVVIVHIINFEQDFFMD